MLVFLVKARRARGEDLPHLWALNNIPNIGATADSTMPIDLPIPDGPPPAFPDLAGVEANFVRAGGDFIVVEEGSAIVGMGGFRPRPDRRAEMLRVRVHPAGRRLGIGRALVGELEKRARDTGFIGIHLDTATNQPEAVAFYRALGYRELCRETRPEWSWTLVYFIKDL
jgi:ribosomal protein S18 acetylase RimI-like enzyme